MKLFKKHILRGSDIPYYYDHNTLIYITPDETTNSYYGVSYDILKDFESMGYYDKYGYYRYSDNNMTIKEDIERQARVVS